MKIENFTLQSNFDNLPLHATVYEPSGEKKGILQILHGMCEYKERYKEFMEFFAQNGYVVACHDQRGHGDSVLKEEDRGYFYETSGEAIVEDAAQVTRVLKEKYPNLPVILFGPSMGSMVARCYLRGYGNQIDKLIVSGSPSKNPLAGVAIALTKTIAFFRGKRYRSKFLAYVSTGKGNAKFKGEQKGAWLSKNRENIEEFYTNPKGRFRFTCNGFENLFRLMKQTYNKKGLAPANPALPIHFVSGGDDPVLVNEVEWLKSIEFLREAGFENVSGKLYQGMRHEIHNEPKEEREIVLRELLAFIEG